ncbi:hypothetical protein ACWCP6_28840 [Streptomyces sp. NPDC002004]
MKHDAELHVDGFDQRLSEEEVLNHLAELRHRVTSRTPILDDDDYETAVDEVADEITELFS